MRINFTYRSLLDKSVSSLLSAIEIYNKPNFSYREETFAILAVNSWEILLKAKLLKVSKYDIRSLYIMVPVKTRNGESHKRYKQPIKNRANNPLTCDIFEVLSRLKNAGIPIPQSVIGNIESLVELRDNAIHFTNEGDIHKQVQELGFACIKNYINIIKLWDIEIDLSKYNLYLMPLAYIDSKTFTVGVTTNETKRYLDFVKNKIDHQDVDEDFDIAVSIEVRFEKGNSFSGLGYYYDPEGLPVNLTEEDFNKKYPHTFQFVCDKCRKRYVDFKKNSDFYSIMRSIKNNPALFHERELEPGNPKSLKKTFYSSNIWKILDQHYRRR
ncbi:MAG: hypothetical protein PWQ72_2025 [Pseudothermotoga sp.]|nr:hypothetical protein [Pseudothermotoga sp.]